MHRIETFKQHIIEKRAVKVCTGIDNFDIEKISKIINSAQLAGASAIDICANEEIITNARQLTDLPLIVSSINPTELAKAIELGADGIEIGNFETFYKKGIYFSANEILSIVKQTLSLLNGEKPFFTVTIPCEISISEQISLAQKLEYLGIDLIQTEGRLTSKENFEGVRGLLARAEQSLANTIELSHNIDAPIMTSSGINATTAPLAFSAGASAISIGSCVNKLNSEISMIATIKSIVEIAHKNKQDVLELV